MESERIDLRHLKKKNPFIVPEGYMEGLTDQIMNSLPEQKPEEKERTAVSFMDRVRPWLYLAAVFAGLGLFFKMFVGRVEREPVLLPEDRFDEYWEYLEGSLADSFLAEEFADIE